jgi:GMP synthase (glutamine-hydrolysing)
VRPRVAVALRHVYFEDLGSFEPVLVQAGYRIVYHDVTAGLDADQIADADLLVILGGPIGAYDDNAYPFLRDELNILARRLAADLPTLGICLGAQLIARTLGSRVYPAPAKEIGWSEIALSAEGRTSPLRALAGTALLHWHGNTFDLPDGCIHLASTALCRNQAFARGPRLLGLQFHPEVRAEDFERWLVGHAAELTAARIDPSRLRAEAAEAGPSLEPKTALMIQEWLGALDP